MAFYGLRYYCNTCEKPYHDRHSHTCKEKCPCCFTSHDRSKRSQYIPCKDCNRTFWNKHCIATHRTIVGKAKKSICALIKKCPKCKIAGPVTKHICGKICAVCHDRYIDKSKHQCYISKKKIKEDPYKQFIFYDIEAMLAPQEDSKYNSEHVANLLVCQRVCQPCADSKEKLECDTCIQKVFKGTSCVSEFVSWVFLPENLNSTVIAHNQGNYDANFIMDELLIQGKSPVWSSRGTKILEISIPKTKVRFVDSMNFIPAALSKLPKMFGLKELKKGYFPYSLYTPENQYLPTLPNYPPKEMYDPESMCGGYSDETGELIGPIGEFFIWYDSVKHKYFDLHAECLAYCISDVTILREAQ